VADPLLLIVLELESGLIEEPWPLANEVEGVMPATFTVSAGVDVEVVDPITAGFPSEPLLLLGG
jgi:hypothetical protein